MKKAAAGEHTAQLPGCAASIVSASRGAGSSPGAPIPLLQQGVSGEHWLLLGPRLHAGLESEQSDA